MALFSLHHSFVGKTTQKQAYTASAHISYITRPQAATAILDWALMAPLDPATYGELVQFGKVLPWSAGTPRDPELPNSSSREHLAQYLAQYRGAGAG